MLAHIYGVSVYFTYWVLAVAGAILVALAMTTEAGLPRRPSLARLVLLAVMACTCGAAGARLVSADR